MVLGQKVFWSDNFEFFFQTKKKNFSSQKFFFRKFLNFFVNFNFFGNFKIPKEISCRKFCFRKKFGKSKFAVEQAKRARYTSSIGTRLCSIFGLWITCSTIYPYFKMTTIFWICCIKILLQPNFPPKKLFSNLTMAKFLAVKIVRKCQIAFFGCLKSNFWKNFQILFEKNI